MKTRRSQTKLPKLKISYAEGSCELGKMIVGVEAAGICAVLLGDRHETLRDELQSYFPQAEISLNNTELAPYLQALLNLSNDPKQELNLPLVLRGSPFQQRVWQMLRHIPPSQTLTYTELAQQIGQPKAVRAVASACAANKIAIAIPCHRVLRKDGSLSGYRWGVERKRQLLAHEAQR